jgi:hypothetical protein
MISFTIWQQDQAIRLSNLTWQHHQHHPLALEKLHARPQSLFVWSSLQTFLLKKKLQTKMSEDSSYVLQTFLLKIELQTIAYLSERKLQTKLQT